MSFEIIIVFIVLIVSLILFIWDRLRYDVVAFMALLIVTVFGILPIEETFLGFANPAVITVVAVLVISQGLINSGLVDIISKWISKVGSGTFTQILILTGTVAILSAFMNNVGALALLLPVAIKIARKNGKSPSLFLMPLAFGSHFGGWITLIGTPPNLIISSFRERYGVGPFYMFDFSLIGIGISVCCILFISLVGWRLIPQRKSQDSGRALSQVQDYLLEVRVNKSSKVVGKRIYDLENLSDADITIVSLLRNDKQIPAPSHLRVLREDDILIVQGNQEDLKLLVDTTGLELIEKTKFDEFNLDSEDISVLEVVVAPNSMMERKTLRSLDLRNKYGVNVLAIAHQERRSITRLSRMRLRKGDVLMLQIPKETIDETLSTLGCLPLAERVIRLGKPRHIILALIIFGTAIFLTTISLLPVQIAFSLAALAMILTGMLSLQEAYNSINWPIIILLGAMIPVGLSLETSGGAELLASILLKINISPLVVLIVILIIAMVLSDIVNNVATVILLAPIAVNIALSLGVSIDPFLIALVIGASSAFLTPIGHQSNVLVMGPGGFKFGDYWRLGLGIQIIIIIVAVPLILTLFPF